MGDNRRGMTTTGVVNEPATPEGTGLEADKMSKKHIAYHFDSFPWGNPAENSS